MTMSPPKASGDCCECLPSTLASAAEGTPIWKHCPSSMLGEECDFLFISRKTYEPLSSQTKGNSHRPLGKVLSLEPKALGRDDDVFVVSSRIGAEQIRFLSSKI